MELSYRPYTPADKEACLRLFDINCPEYFAPNERQDYHAFLTAKPTDYELCIANGSIAGAFGLRDESANQSRIEWILLDLNLQGAGMGSSIMERILAQAKQINATLILIATSHKAYLFFEKFGAVMVAETENGWGTGMHKIDMELRR